MEIIIGYGPVRGECTVPANIALGALLGQALEDQFAFATTQRGPTLPESAVGDEWGYDGWYPTYSVEFVGFELLALVYPTGTTLLTNLGEQPNWFVI